MSVRSPLPALRPSDSIPSALPGSSHVSVPPQVDDAPLPHATDWLDMRKWKFVALAVLIAGVPSVPARAGFTQIVSFGDSISDTGNTFLAAGIPGAPYFEGRFSNGPVWVEVLAGLIGVAPPAPSLVGGTNNSWGGAETGVGPSFMGTPNLGTQVAAFVAANTLAPTQLVTITGGGNDFLNAGQNDPIVPVNNISSAITGLVASGGRNFIVANLPRLGQVPATAGLPAANRDALDVLSLTYNGFSPNGSANSGRFWEWTFSHSISTAWSSPPGRTQRYSDSRTRPTPPSRTASSAATATCSSTKSTLPPSDTRSSAWRRQGSSPSLPHGPCSGSDRA